MKDPCNIASSRLSLAIFSPWNDWFLFVLLVKVSIMWPRFIYNLLKYLLCFFQKIWSMYYVVHYCPYYDEFLYCCNVVLFVSLPQCLWRFLVLFFADNNNFLTVASLWAPVVAVSITVSIGSVNLCNICSVIDREGHPLPHTFIFLFECVRDVSLPYRLTVFTQAGLFSNIWGNIIRQTNFWSYSLFQTAILICYSWFIKGSGYMYEGAACSSIIMHASPCSIFGDWKPIFLNWWSYQNVSILSYCE